MIHAREARLKGPAPLLTSRSGRPVLSPPPGAYVLPVVPQLPRPVVLADGRRARAAPGEPTRRALVLFGAGTAVALFLLAVATALLAGRAAEREGVNDARRVTEVVAHTVIEPQLTDALVRGDATALAQLDRHVRRHVLGRTQILRIKLWSSEGRILYSDEPLLIGATYALGKPEREVLRRGGVRAQSSELHAAENRYERDLAPQLLETYLAVSAPGGGRLLFEAYYSSEVVDETRRGLLTSFASISLLALLIFAAVQLTLGWVGLRWVREERERLVDEAAEVSRRERLRVASDLHDGTLQDLVGASYVVAGAVGTVRRLGADDVADGLQDAAGGIRSGVQSLRSMIVDIYPESLQAAGLHAALSDLVAPLRAQRTAVSLDVPDDLALTQDVEQAVYRAAQEAVRNIAHHAKAAHVSVEVAVRSSTVVLLVKDDGIGFDAEAGAPLGHLGLRTLADRTTSRGGSLELLSGPGTGTHLRMVLPA